MSTRQAQDKQKITPFLWFNDNAEEAAEFYVSVFSAKFPDSKILNISRYDEAGAKASGRPVGSAMVVAFTLNGQEFTALNGGPVFTFNESVSFVINCESQEEVDHFWEKLSAVPESEQCGWLKDKYGLSWQVVPRQLGEMLGDKDPQKASRVMQAMLQMKKIDVAKLQEAYDRK
ncbi:MAG: VOC family protein [bacterium]|nr:VOC family protein [bacterium]